MKLDMVLVLSVLSAPFREGAIRPSISRRDSVRSSQELLAVAMAARRGCGIF